MKIWKDGDEALAICPTCERRTGVVYERRTVELEDPNVQVPGVLVAVCRECGGIAAIPHQSTPRLRTAMESRKEVMNVRLPGHLLDVLTLIADRWAPRGRSAAPTLLRVLLHEFGTDPAFAHRAKEGRNDPLAQGPADHDLSVRVATHVLIAVDEMAEIVGLDTRTDVVRGLLVAAKEDVIDERDPARAEALGRALAGAA